MDKPLQVSEITNHIKGILEQGFHQVYVEGEISNFRPSSTGHLYFSLKDEYAVIQTVMFKNRSFSLNFKPEDGMLVRVRGSVSVYAQRGSYQIICESIEQAGQGQILAVLEKRKQKLAAEGLFDPERKKRLPLLPSGIAVISSPTGAAVRDILQVIGRRNSSLDVVILPAPVQGNEAAEIIAAQIRRADKFSLGDVIIVGRGGGSLEDLLPFSEESVVRAIAGCSIPVISAVGHEIDYALSDFAADLRAATPSAAAELVSADRDDITERILEIHNQLRRNMKDRMERIRQLTTSFTPASLEREIRIIMQPLMLKLDDEKENLLSSMNFMIKQTRQKTESLCKQLEAVSPEKVLERGYSIVSLEENEEIITDADKAPEGTRLRIILSKGKLKAEVKK